MPSNVPQTPFPPSTKSDAFGLTPDTNTTTTTTTRPKRTSATTAEQGMRKKVRYGFESDEEDTLDLPPLSRKVTRGLAKGRALPIADDDDDGFVVPVPPNPSWKARSERLRNQLKAAFQDKSKDPIQGDPVPGTQGEPEAMPKELPEPLTLDLPKGYDTMPAVVSSGKFDMHPPPRMSPPKKTRSNKRKVADATPVDVPVHVKPLRMDPADDGEAAVHDAPDLDLDLDLDDYDEEFIVPHGEEVEDIDAVDYGCDVEDGPASELEASAEGSIQKKSHPSNLVRRCQKSPPRSVQEWLHKFDMEHPVAADDTDVLNFQEKLLLLLERLGDHAKTTWSNFVVNPREKREMVMYFMSRLMIVKPETLHSMILQQMPRRAQQVLGRRNLTAKDLLDLPEYDVQCDTKEMMRQWATYIDVATAHLEHDLVEHSTPRKFKKLATGREPRDCTEARVYCGSSVGRPGAHTRLRAHWSQIFPGAVKLVNARHYDFARRQDVIPNFRIAGIWDNPYLASDAPDQDHARWQPVFLEGILQMYLNLATDPNRPVRPFQEYLWPRDFVDAMRDGLDLPNIEACSLNSALSLAQGVNGGASRGVRCGNPECRRYCNGHLALDSRFPAPTTKSMRAVGGMGPKYCASCHAEIRAGRPLPTRIGVANGQHIRENSPSTINNVWAKLGHPVECSNPACKGAFLAGAKIFGMEAGMLCFLCYSFKTHFHRHWSKTDHNESTSDKTECDECHKNLEGDDTVVWDGDSRVILQARRGKPAALKGVRHLTQPEVVCHDCHDKRRSFLSEPIPKTTGNPTVPACFDVDCRWIDRMGGLHLVEDINEHTWRCLACDWSRSIHGITMGQVIELTQAGKELPRPYQEPIASHRHNATSCQKCGAYATFGEWMPTDEGGHICSSCTDRVCANKDHKIPHPALVKSWTTNDDGEDVCDPCKNSNRRKSTITACSVCGEKRPVSEATEGRCADCQREWNKDHKARNDAAKLANMSDARRNGKCSNCGDSPISAHGRCAPCYNFWFSHGKAGERPTTVASKKCSNCGEERPKLTRGRCRSCYEAWPRTGKKKDRPPQVEGELPKCSNCGKEARCLRLEMCNACYLQKRRDDEEKKKDRPMQAEPVPTCSKCGKEANRLRLKMCTACYLKKRRDDEKKKRAA